MADTRRAGRSRAAIERGIPCGLPLSHRLELQAPHKVPVLVLVSPLTVCSIPTPNVPLSVKITRAQLPPLPLNTKWSLFLATAEGGVYFATYRGSFVGPEPALE